MIIDYPMWDEIAAALHMRYVQTYLTTENYIPVDPLFAVTVPPDTDKFFGTKTLTLYIVGIPFGWEVVDGVWEDLWPPEGFEDSVIRHNEKYEQFAIYECKVWVDFNIVAQVMSANPDSRFEEMMQATETHIIDMCSRCAGFTYMGRIEAAIEASYFHPLIDEFLLLDAV